MWRWSRLLRWTIQERIVVQYSRASCWHNKLYWERPYKRNDLLIQNQSIPIRWHCVDRIIFECCRYHHTCKCYGLCKTILYRFKHYCKMEQEFTRYRICAWTVHRRKVGTAYKNSIKHQYFVHCEEPESKHNLHIPHQNVQDGKR